MRNSRAVPVAPQAEGLREEALQEEAIETVPAHEDLDLCPCSLPRSPTADATSLLVARHRGKVRWGSTQDRSKSTYKTGSAHPQFTNTDRSRPKIRRVSVFNRKPSQGQRSIEKNESIREKRKKARFILPVSRHHTKESDSPARPGSANHETSANPTSS